MIDSITIVQDSLNTPSTQVVGVIDELSIFSKIWPYLFGLLILLVLFLLFIAFSNAKKSRLKQKVIQNDVDMDNLLNSAFLAQKLYDELRVKYHPDRYLNEEQNREATEISQLLGKYKYDYKKLLEIKDRAENCLGIKA